MTNKLEAFSKKQLKTLPDIRPGDTVKVSQKIKEKDKERIQAFEGIIIAKKHGKGVSGTITVRRVISGVGVEKVFPIHSPIIEKIEVIRKGKVRRSKLYYLRTAKGKKAKLKKKGFAEAVAEPETPVEITEAPKEAEVAAETETPEQK